MSSRKGDSKRKGQKYQNSTAFKNNLHDTSNSTKNINALVVAGVCARCREIIEWRRKFKKYKPLNAPKKCVKCEQKTVKHAYHTICVRCASESGACEKCGTKGDDITRSEPPASVQAAKDSQLQEELKYLTERQRRAFFRELERGTSADNALQEVIKDEVEENDIDKHDEDNDAAQE